MSASVRRRDESGVVAIMVGIMSLVLLGVAALTVDLSNAFVQKHDMQERTDFAALAGGAGDNLPATASGLACSSGSYSWTAPSATDPAVTETAAYLDLHLPSDQAVTAGQLVNCDLADGEAGYGTWSSPDSGGYRSFTPDPNQLSVISQSRQVKFSFAGALGLSSVDVDGQATVEAVSPAIHGLPMYATAGCDYGRQTLAQPSNGQAASTVNLANGSDSNDAVLTSLTTDPATSPAAVPYPVAAGTTLTINGSKLAGVTRIGFFESGTTSPGPAPTVLDSGQFTVGADGTSITVPAVPTGLAQDAWYLRVEKGGSWSTVADQKGTLNALPLTVGAPTLSCVQGSSAGNFGTLLLFDDNGPSGQTDNLAYNIAVGLQHTLATYPGAAAPWTCSSSQTETRLWPTEGTNCADTKTGNVVANAAYEGFVTGVSGYADGLLTDVDPGTGCPNNGQPDAQPLVRTLNGYEINNDTLSCFLTSTTTTVGDVNSASYALDGPALSPAIYSSPRFLYVPVLGTVPSNGGSQSYQIIDFRPAFLTDQPSSANRASAPTEGNGLTMTSNNKSLLSLQVVMINPKALPPQPPDASAYTEYTGSGPKGLRLVD